MLVQLLGALLILAAFTLAQSAGSTCAPRPT